MDGARDGGMDRQITFLPCIEEILMENPKFTNVGFGLYVSFGLWEKS